MNAVLGGLLSTVCKMVLPREFDRLSSQLRELHEVYVLNLKHSMPQTLIRALVFAEDRRFYLHTGVDFLAIGRALLLLVLRKELTGASTIEQQLIRTLTNHRERSIRRKVRETLLATTVSRVVAKADLPGMYLSVGYFGWKMTGIVQACERLGYILSNLNEFQAASIVARLKYPESANPNLERSRQIRRRTIYLLRKGSGSGLRLLTTEGIKSQWSHSSSLMRVRN